MGTIVTLPRRRKREKDWSEARNSIAKERSQRFEFLIVVIMIGLALNLCASLVWDFMTPISIFWKSIIVASTLLITSTIALFVIYFRPSTERRLQFYAEYSFLPIMNSTSREVLLHFVRENQFISGPMLRRVGEYLKIDRFKSASKPNFDVFGEIGPFLGIEPLLNEFRFQWTDSSDLPGEFIKLINPNGEISVCVRQESLGGVLLDFSNIWRILSESLHDYSLHSVETLREIYCTLSLKLPPKTDIRVTREEAASEIRLRNPYVEVSIKIAPIMIHGDIGSALFNLSCNAKYTFLSKFRPNYADYLIWVERIMSSMQSYFEPDARMTYDDKINSDDFPAIIGDQRQKIYYYCHLKKSQNGKFPGKTYSIQQEDVKFFATSIDAKSAGYSEYSLATMNQ